MKTVKRFITCITIMAMILALSAPVQTEARAKSAPKLNKTKVTLDLAGKKTKTYQLKVKGASGKVTWKTSNKKVATVSKKGKVTVRKKGTAVITAKVNKKTLKCKITVKNTHKHHWVAHLEWWHKNIFGFVCYCGKVFESGEEWQQHSDEEVFALLATGDPDIILNTPLQHDGFAGAKTVYYTALWHYDCDICGFHDYEDEYPHIVKAVICSGCGKEFKDYDKWMEHFLENSYDGDEGHRECTIQLEQ